MNSKYLQHIILHSLLFKTHRLHFMAALHLSLSTPSCREAAGCAAYSVKKVSKQVAVGRQKHVRP